MTAHHSVRALSTATRVLGSGERASIRRVVAALVLVAASAWPGGFSGSGPALSAAAGRDVLIRNATVIDGTGRGPRAAVDLLLSGGIIARIGSRIEAPAATTVIDGTGKFITPGLIDTHTHLDFPMVFQLSPEERAKVLDHIPKALLYNGVTTVLNVSAQVPWIWNQRAAQREGRLVAPRIYAMGRSFTPDGGWGSRHGSALSSADQARAQALEYVAAGTDGFKIVLEHGLGNSGTYNVMPEDMLAVIVQVARQHDVPMYVHAINLVDYRRAVTFSPRAIVHGLQDPVADDDALLRELVERGIAVVPTLSLWESFNRFTDKPSGFDDPVLRESLPPFLFANMRRPDFMAEEKKRFLAVARMDAYTWARDSLPVFMANTKRMHRAGVRLGTGTDAGGTVGYNFQGYNTPRELELFVEAGLSPMDALVAATRNGAAIIGVSDRLGTVEAGKRADLLMLAANPLDDIRNIRRIETVVIDGVPHPRADFSSSPAGR